MRVLLVSEGYHEHADAIWGSPGDTGALEVLVRRLLDREIDFESRKPNDRDFRRVRVHGKGHAYEKVVVPFLLEAERRGFDAVVFLIDEDGDQERRAAMEAAQANRRSALPRACGAAIRSFDAWMLADEQALSSLLGIAVSTSPEPERLRNPKAICERYRDEAGCKRRLRDLYANYASHAKLNLLKQRCPEGFGRFAERVENLAR
ncbi:MAG: DUF4276 family protein [Planctomycetota bacterium]|nr:DUF4276 family protein [Planctomycetota bacterium]